jgi:hypothetical protein
MVTGTAPIRRRPGLARLRQVSLTDRKAWVRRWATGAVLVTAACLHTYAYYFNQTPGIYAEGGGAQSVAHLNDSYIPFCSQRTPETVSSV